MVIWQWEKPFQQKSRLASHKTFQNKYLFVVPVVVKPDVLLLINYPVLYLTHDVLWVEEASCKQNQVDKLVGHKLTFAATNMSKETLQTTRWNLHVQVQVFCPLLCQQFYLIYQKSGRSFPHP